jgi:hypothetical protein
MQGWKDCNTRGEQTSGRSRVRLITTRMGLWPPSRLVVKRGLSRRTVLPPTMTASATARCANTLCRDCELLTHAACPVGVAILPSIVMAYLRVDIGTPRTALCRSACTQCFCYRQEPKLRENLQIQFTDRHHIKILE